MGKALSGKLSCPCDRPCPTFSYYYFFLGLFLPFSFFFSENSFFFYIFAVKSKNNFSFKENLWLQESAPFTPQFLGA